MAKKNCWEYMNCGRGPGTRYVCPAAAETCLDGVNNGKNAGRVCWMIAGTFCNGEVQGAHTEKIGNCMKCDFYWLVSDEEGEDFASSKAVFIMLSADGKL